MFTPCRAMLDVLPGPYFSLDGYYFDFFFLLAMVIRFFFFLKTVASPARGANRTCSHLRTGDATAEKNPEKNARNSTFWTFRDKIQICSVTGTRVATHMHAIFSARCLRTGDATAEKIHKKIARNSKC